VCPFSKMMKPMKEVEDAQPENQARNSYLPMAFIILLLCLCIRVYFRQAS